MFKLLLLLFSTAFAQSTPSQEIQVVQFVSSSWQESNKLKMTFETIPHHKIYKESIKVKPGFGNELTLKNPQISPLESFYDKYSKTSKEGVTGRFEIVYEVYTSQDVRNEAYPLVLEYQACSEEYCLFPQEFAFKTPIFLNNSSYSLDRLMSEGLLLAVIFVFFAGFLTSFTPCIFPMIPLTLAVLVPKGQQLSFGVKLRRSFLYVLGIALTYSVFGVIAATSGMMFGSILGNQWVAVGIGLFFLGFALSMLGFFEIKTPSSLSNSFVFKNSNTFLFGLAAGVIAGPCVGPVLLSILTFISKTGNVTTGFILMMSFAFGMGLIFIILGIAGDLAKVLPSSGNWLNFIKYIFALIMVILSFYYVRPVLSPAQFTIYAAFSLFVISLCYLLFYEKRFYVPMSAAARRVFVVTAVISALGMGAALAYSGKLNALSETSHFDDGWKPYSEQAFAESLKNGKPTIVDFYADWCMSCKELKFTTFKNADVIAKTAGFNLLMVDATRLTPEIEKLKKEKNVIGLPAIFFYSKSGKAMPDATLSGFENSELFLKRIETVLQHD